MFCMYVYHIYGLQCFVCMYNVLYVCISHIWLTVFCMYVYHIYGFYSLQCFVYHPWDVFICFLAVFTIIFGIIYWLVNQGNRNRLTKPIQQKYTEQEDRELVLLCNKHILEIHYDIPYMVEAQRERQINFRNSLFVI